MKKALITVAIVLVAIPVAAVATFLLMPFWSWFEAKTGIESIDHSGPAEWCFVLVYFFIALTSLFACLWMRSRSDGIRRE
jgi:hypothetical protein